MLMEFQGVRGHPRAAPCEATARAVVSRLRGFAPGQGLYQDRRTGFVPRPTPPQATLEVYDTRQNFLFRNVPYPPRMTRNHATSPPAAPANPGITGEPAGPRGPGTRMTRDHRRQRHARRTRQKDRPKQGQTAKRTTPRHRDAPGTGNFKTDGRYPPGMTTITPMADAAITLFGPEPQTQYVFSREWRLMFSREWRRTCSPGNGAAHVLRGVAPRPPLA